ncbi:MAG: pyrroline-5-carboxylate reductase [Acidimicrobiales bacterium]|jgi:pyrroline-5-carboxylate reductase
MARRDDGATVKRPRLLVVGGGRMGGALLEGLVTAGWRPGDLAVVEQSAPRRTELAALVPGVVVGATVGEADGAVLAVKPADARAACEAVAGTATPRVLSIMAGVTLGSLEDWLAPGTAVVRAMPNTPATVGAGVSAIAAGAAAGEADLQWAEELLGAVGQVVRLPETALDAVTGLSGSGPAYVFLMVEALAAAGEAVGLPAEVSALLAAATVTGAARLLERSGEAPAALRAQVTSPGGTTEAGLRVLDDRGVRDAVAAAVAAATERSRQLGAAPAPGAEPA